MNITLTYTLDVKVKHSIYEMLSFFLFLPVIIKYWLDSEGY